MTKDTARELPTLYTTTKCTACYESVDFEDGAFYCHKCKIEWQTGDPFSEASAVFSEDDEGNTPEACGHPISDPRQVRHEGPPRVVGDEKTKKAPHWWPEGAVKQVPIHRTYPCSLPSVHEDDHYFPADCVFNYYDAEDNLIESGEEEE